MQLDFLLWLETLRHPALTALFGLITMLGDNLFYVLILILIYWTRSREESYKLMRIIVFSSLINVIIKDLVGALRPFQTTTEIVGLWIFTAGGNSFPSGHAQIAATFWMYTALYFKQTRITIAAVVMTLLIAFSRLYLGVHWPADVAVGLVLGIFSALLGYYFLKKFSRLFWAATIMLSLYGIFVLQDHSSLRLSFVFLGAVIGDRGWHAPLPHSRDIKVAHPTFFQKFRQPIEVFIGILALVGVKIGFEALLSGIGLGVDLTSALTYTAVGITLTYGVPKYIMLQRGIK